MYACVLCEVMGARPLGLRLPRRHLAWGWSMALAVAPSRFVSAFLMKRSNDRLNETYLAQAKLRLALSKQVEGREEFDKNRTYMN